MKHLVHKKRFSRKGVSDIIGNLLILAITVTLFSSILYYVVSMPTPGQKTYGDFSATIDYTHDNESNAYPFITIMHTGGAVLSDPGAVISIIVDNSPTNYHIADGRPLDTTWGTGESWIVNATDLGILPTSRVDLMITDQPTNSLVWSSVLLDPSARVNPPVIMSKWFAGEIDTDLWISTDLLTQDQQAILFAKVYDVDNDVETVTANLSELGGPVFQTLEDSNNDGIYSGAPFTVDCDVGAWTVTIDASDGVRQATSTLTIIVRSPTDSNNHNGGSSGGIGDGPANLMYSFFQGFNTFNYDDWIESNYSAEPTTYFNRTDKVVVVVASKFLVNTENENTMLVIDPITKNIISGVSSPNVKFVRYDYISSYYVYTCTIDTSSLSDGKRYLLQMQLKDSWIPNDVFYATQTITIGHPGFPVFETYSDSAYNNRCENFTTGSTIYVLVKDQLGGVWDQMGGDVSIMDYFWKTQLKRIPSNDAGNPVSPVVQTGNSYKFSIDLSAAKQDPWVPGTNTYILKYDVFKAGSETYSLSKLVNITAPKIILDVVTGCDGTQNNAWGNNVFIEFYRNEDQWASPDYVEFTMEKTSITRVTQVRIADVNGDKKNDVLAVVGIGNGNTVSYYEINLYLNDGQWTKKTVATGIVDQPKSIELGNIDLDGDLDIAVGFNSGGVGYYRNDGLWTYYSLSSGTSVNAIKFIDLDTSTAYPYMATGLDLVIGRSAGGVTVCKNLNHIGTSWQTTTWTGGITSMFFEQAASDVSVTGTTTGNYMDTRGITTHETIQEAGLAITDASYPIAPYLPATTAPVATFDNIRVPDNIGFTVATGQTLVIRSWGPPGVLSEPFTKLELEVRYQTGSSYPGTDHIKWCVGASYAGGLQDAILISKSTTWTTAKVTLTGGPWSLDDLQNMSISFTNSASGSNRNVMFDYWRIDATSAGGEMAVDHAWTFLNVPAGSHTFSADAWAPNAGEDTFEFQYSLDGITYSSMPTPLIVNSATSATYASSLPIGAFSGTLYVRVVDSIRSGDPHSDSVCVNNMYVKSAVTGSGSIGAVSGISIEDMNGDSYQDMVVADTRDAWVGINDKAGAVTSLTTNMQKVTASALSGIVRVAGGNFIGADNTMDVLIATSANGIYFVGQATNGIFGAVQGPFSVSGVISDLAYGDVDGDGKTDIVIAQNNVVVLYLNHGTTFGEWRRYVVDMYTTNSGGAVPINSISLGKVNTGA